MTAPAKPQSAARGGPSVRSRAKYGDVQDFLDRFGRALTAGDGRTIASLWEVPALVIDDAGTRAVASAKEIEAFFGGAKEQYNEQGITDTRAEIVTLDWLTDRIVQVQVRWPYLDDNNDEHGEERSTYTLRRDDSGKLRLRVAVMQGASTHVEAHDGSTA